MAIASIILHMATPRVAICFGGGNGAVLRIELAHVVGGKNLGLDTIDYVNAVGQHFNVTKFKYYIGKVNLLGADGGAGFVDADYFLVNEEEPDSKAINVQGLKPGTYSGLEFLLGVDSVDNCSGAQSGALDPVNGMFWAWNSGYIFLKLEGKAPASQSAGKVFEYHIGGYKAPGKNMRKITLRFPRPVDVASGKTLDIELVTDIGKLLDGPTQVDFSKLSSVTVPNSGGILADNIAHMFELRGVNVK